MHHLHTIYRVRFQNKLVKIKNHRTNTSWEFIDICLDGKWGSFPSEYQTQERAQQMIIKAGLIGATIIPCQQIVESKGYAKSA